MTKTRNVLAVVMFAVLLTMSMPSMAAAEKHNSDRTNSTNQDRANPPQSEETNPQQSDRPNHQRGEKENRPNVDEEENKVVSAKILGWLQLQAHDLFFVERGDRINAETATDFENGKLDLSTLLIDMTTGEPFSDEKIANGGEARNSENIMLFTIASNLGQKYLEVRDAEGEDAAYEEVMRIYKHWIEKSYKYTFGERLPAPQEGTATMTENLAYRTLHDLLLDEIVVDGQTISTLDPSLVGQTLNHRELRQPGSPLDGQFDEGFLNIEFTLPDGTPIVFSLLDADSTFADQFETDFSFEFFLGEVQDGHYDQDDEVMKQIRSLIAKGQSF